MRFHLRAFGAAFTVVTTLAALLTIPAAPASAAFQDAHWLGAMDHGNLYHTMRRPDGSWTGLGDVRGANGTTVDMVETAAATNTFGQLHVLGVDRDGGLWHAIRRGDGSWTGFTAVFPFAGYPGEVSRVAAETIDDTLYVFVITQWGLSYAVRRFDGSWEPFRPMHPTLPQVSPPLQVAVTEAVGGILHLVVLGTDGVVYHRVRWQDDTWSPYGSLGIPPWELVVDVAIAAEYTGVHVAFVTKHPHINVLDTKVFHRMRHPDGSWTPWAYAGAPPGQLIHIGATGSFDSGVQFTVSATYGQVYHRLRRPNGTWTQWGHLAQREFGGDVEMATEQ